ncbi:MAG TPA: metallophosphoesterase family protein [Acidobacteriaceae bacterium]|jgi:hypothetical protein|nr:metallophosphoesterase family protein [Acidobacteriaceae bacterium]
MLVGVLSDTHGLLRPQALEALRGASHILHAGDIGDISILDALKKIAPVTAIRGNIDQHGPCAQLPTTEALELNGAFIYMLHSLADLDLNPQAAGIRVVISGHSHKPAVTERNGILYLNPGSAGPRRFSLPTTIAHLYIEPASVHAEIIELAIPS